jgi:hypothetical protein
MKTARCAINEPFMGLGVPWNDDGVHPSGSVVAAQPHSRAPRKRVPKGTFILGTSGDAHSRRPLNSALTPWYTPVGLMVGYRHSITHPDLRISTRTWQRQNSEGE